MWCKQGYVLVLLRNKRILRGIQKLIKIYPFISKMGVIFNWTNTSKSKYALKNYDKFITGLKNIYTEKLLPLENASNFHYFHSPPLVSADFEAKPTVMLVGQYSTGKTTFIRYLLKNDYPGMRIGPEPTTDKFISLMYSNTTKVIPGNALVSDPSKHYRHLSKFGNNFLNKFQCSLISSEVLKDITIVDTPGILSGEKQRLDRGYDFMGVLKWFAERADRLLLLFDSYKLDISDEFRRSIEALQGHDEKIRIILNKADAIDQQQLMRVHGALMWSLGKILKTPEVTRVYVGSFWDRPLVNNDYKRLFEAEEQDLLKDLMDLPKDAGIRKLNDFIKRARLAKAHALIIDVLYKKMPYFIGKEKKKYEIIRSLDKIYLQVQELHNVSSGDCPNCDKMKEKLLEFDFSTFTPVRKRLIDNINEMLDNDISQLMNLINDESVPLPNTTSGGIFETLKDDASPFILFKGEGVSAGEDEEDWIVNKSREKYDSLFHAIKSKNEKVISRVAKSEMVKSQLPNSVLADIWKLSDVDKDGAFDCDEFALAMYLIELKVKGHALPNSLPNHLVPPNKRNGIFKK